MFYFVVSEPLLLSKFDRIDADDVGLNGCIGDGEFELAGVRSGWILGGT